MINKRVLFFILFALSWILTTPTYAIIYQKTLLPRVTGDHLKLGIVDFPVSTHSSLAKAHFLLGLKYLHNFMYPLALREFKLAELNDPNFAMSYWGMAMTYKWSLWSYENKKKGSEVLRIAKSNKNLKTSPLEKGLLDAISLIYGPGTTLENEEKYMLAMKKLYQQHRDNADVASFYALSLIAYASDAPENKNANSMMQEARQILKNMIQKYPGHPGIIHYYVHVNDIPNSPYPKSALFVIKNIYEYLSDSSHVLHMPSHLYTILGMWTEAERANQTAMKASRHLCDFLDHEQIGQLWPEPEVSVNVSHGMCSSLTNVLSEEPIKVHDTLNKSVGGWTLKQKYACDSDNLYHALEWLHYAYLQMNQFEKASKLVAEMKIVSDIEQQPVFDFWLYRMQARQILYTQQYSPLINMAKPLIEFSADKAWASYSESGQLLADGMRAIRHRQKPFISLIESRFQKVIDQVSSPGNAMFKQASLLNKAEFDAVKTIEIDGNTAEGKKIFDRALKIQFYLQSLSQSLTLPYIPVQELYGEYLLNNPNKNNVKKAIKLFQNELNYYPNRPQALSGLAKAEKISHQLAT